MEIPEEHKFKVGIIGNGDTGKTILAEVIISTFIGHPPEGVIIINEQFDANEIPAGGEIKLVSTRKNVMVPPIVTHDHFIQVSGYSSRRERRKHEQKNKKRK